jgi:hypothetical protein
MGSCLIAYLISAALCTQGANAQTKASVLLAHCAVGAHGDDFCRGFVEATVDEIAFFPDERESAHSCFFTDDQLKASTDRLVDIARTALYAMPEPSRYSHNAAVVIRDYFDSHALCKTIKP